MRLRLIDLPGRYILGELMDEANIPSGSDGSAHNSSVSLSSGEATVLSAGGPGQLVIGQPRLARMSAQAEEGAMALEHMMTSELAFVASSRSPATDTAGRVERSRRSRSFVAAREHLAFLRSADGR